MDSLISMITPEFLKGEQEDNWKNNTPLWPNVQLYS